MITNLGELRAAHKRIIESTHAAICFSLHQGLREAKLHVRTKASFRHRSGKVAGGTRGKFRRLASGAVMRITNKAPHAKFLEFGTRPHRITAKPGKMLRFFLRGGGSSALMFRKSVMHPGTKPYRFLQAASKAGHGVAGSTLRRRMGAIARRF